MIYRLALGVLIVMLSLPAVAQLSSKRCKWIVLIDKTVVLDTLTVQPESIEVFDATGNKIFFDYNTQNNSLTPFIPASKPAQVNPQIFPDTTTNQNIKVEINESLFNMPDSVFVCYRVFPLSLGKVQYKRDITRIDMAAFDKSYIYEDFSEREQLFKTPGLNKSGTISRGVSFGNTQNVFVNSSLNLQIEGKLSDEIGITAAITDQNIPFQPEGNTQQLQEFDRVYITLDHSRWNLTAGDVVLRNKPGHFLKFYKNVQGGAGEVRFGEKPERSAVTSAAGAVSKGKFASTQVQPIESVQGPYRLQGPNGERFIIVIANSERVFIDGKLLVRGFDYDYTIDYNQAEITFTPKHIITRNTRIRVDFEYSDRNYNRSVYHLSHYQNVNRFSFYGNYYNESDNPNNPFTLKLDQNQKQILADAGDNLDQAISTGAEKVEFDRNQVLYQQKDTLVDNLVYSVFRYTTDSTQSVFSVSFSEVGINNGNYIQENTTVNGRVFTWVAPVNGVPQGRFEPVRVLPAPLKKQMVNIGGSYQVEKYTRVFAEAASSQFDLNQFSRLDSEDDNGKAFRVGYTMENRPLAKLDAYRLNSSLSYEYTDDYFNAIDRFRDIEYERDWSLANTDSKVSDNIFNFSVGLQQNSLNSVNYRISRRYRQDEVEGIQHWISAARQLGNFQLNGNLFLLNSSQATSESDWKRGDMEVRYPFRNFVPGYAYRFDKNAIKIQNTDSVIASAMYFDEHIFFVESGDSSRTKYRLDYSYRTDLRPFNGELGRREIAQTYNATTNTQLGQNHIISFLFTYRNLNLPDSADVNNVVTQMNWSADLLDKHLRSELAYSIATGREVRREFVYLETAAGEGTHYWQDLNNDGVQDLNEFFEAQAIDQRRFVKIFLPTDEYVTAFTNQFSYRLNANMPRSWRTQKGIRNFLSRFSSLSFISVDKKTTDTDVLTRFNPFSQDFEDEFLISLGQSVRNTLYYNRSNPKFGLEFSTVQNQQKYLLTNGTDTRVLSSQNALTRINLTELFTTRFNVVRSIKENQSDYLTSKNYRIRSYEFMPELAYQPSVKLRFTGTYNYALKENEIEKEGGAEHAVFHELGLESRLSQVSKRTITANLKYVRIDFDGELASAVAVEMLTAYRPGNNLSWSFNMQQRLSNGLNISITYDGRKPNDLAIIHTGRTQVSVLF